MGFPAIWQAPPRSEVPYDLCVNGVKAARCMLEVVAIAKRIQGAHSPGPHSGTNKQARRLCRWPEGCVAYARAQGLCTHHAKQQLPQSQRRKFHAIPLRCKAPA